MAICPRCNSTNILSGGWYTTKSGKVKRHKCGDCKKSFNGNNNKVVKDLDVKDKFKFEDNIGAKRYVITCAQNNVPVNIDFLETLENYCAINNAELIILPIFVDARLYPGDLLHFNVPEKYIRRNKFSIGGRINVLSNINILPTADNPIGGLENLSKGNSLIIPHPQVQLKSLPVSRDSDPIIITTTGTVTDPAYKSGKSGQKAEFNHSYSAVLVDYDKNNDMFHLRHLNADDNGCFYDIHGYYTQTNFHPLARVEALITGDEHIYVGSSSALNATYTGENSMLSRLKPKVIVRHDVLDCFTVSHHHRRDNFLQFSKYVADMNNVHDELVKTLDYIVNTTPKDTKTYIVSSNHHDHLKRWLNEADPKLEPWNALIYHYLTYLMLSSIKRSSGLSSPNPFELFFKEKYSGVDNVEFLDRNKSFKILGIELSNHGDIGANGSRGSLAQFSKFSDKQVIGHSHTPGINKGAMQVGCLTPKELEYTNGPSSWMNTNVVIYPNGRRQMLNIIRGRWF